MTANTADAWAAFHARRAKSRPPIYPHADVVAALAGLVAGSDGHVLLLGATPELGVIGAALTMADWSPTMISEVWQPLHPTRPALLCDWRELPGDLRITAVIGDGSLASNRWPEDYHAMLAVAARLLSPGGKVAIRLFTSPDMAEPLEAVRDAALSGEIGGFHALKWRLAGCVAGQGGSANVAVEAILAAFEQAFPDRMTLAERTGWGLDVIAEIDAYRGNPAVYSFPTRAQALAAVPEGFRDVRLVEAGSYELAERCPILALTRE